MTVSDLAGEADRLSCGGTPVQRPPRTRDRLGRWQRADAGEWDWFYGLPVDLQLHIRAHHMAETGVHPDVMADWNTGDVDEVMTAWAAAIDAGRRRSSRDPLDWDGPELEEIAQDIDPSRYVDAMRVTPVEFSGDDALVGPAEVAERAGVSRATISQWRRRHADFPVPVAVLGAGRQAPRGEAGGMPVWTWGAVHGWLVATGRTGR